MNKFVLCIILIICIGGIDKTIILKRLGIKVDNFPMTYDS